MSGSATLLAFGLLDLYLYNGRRDPFCASIEEIHMLTGLSESAIKIARKQLIEAGLIEYVHGENRKIVSQYRFLIGGNNNPQNEPQIEPLKSVISACPTFLYKNIYSLRERNRKNPHSTEELMPLDKFHYLASDTEWINQVISWLESSTGIKIREDIIKCKYAEFLCYLSASGQTAKTESDMKSHFSNWLKKEIKENKRRKEDGDPTILRTNNISKFKSGEGW